jgi:hypothetical protein
LVLEKYFGDEVISRALPQPFDRHQWSEIDDCQNCKWLHHLIFDSIKQK